MKNVTARHLLVVAAPNVPCWHAFGAGAGVAGVSQGVAVATRANRVTGADTATTPLTGVTFADDKRTTSLMVDPAPSSPPV